MTMQWEQNLEGYRLIADVLVTFRRIVERAHLKTGAKADPADLWPLELRSRLEHRRDNEVGIERLPAGEDGLLAFATFADLGALVRTDSPIASLLDRLSAPGEDLAALLDELEAQRRRLAIAIPLDDGDLERLRELQRTFRGMLAGAGAKGGRRAERPPRQARRSKRSRDAVGEPGDGVEAESKVESSPTTSDSALEKPLPREVSESSSPPWQHLLPLEKAAAPREVVAALSAGDDRKVLAALHGEVLALAEDVYKGNLALEAPIWGEVVARGWVDARKDELGLDPLLRFHDLIEVLAGADATPDTRRSTVKDAGLSALLLELNVMFRRYLVGRR